LIKNKIIVETKKQKDLRLFSKNLLNIKGINNYIDLTDTKIRSRICYGFLDKKKPNDLIEIYQKRWFFLISSKPLTNLGQANDELTLDENSIKDKKLKFNVLYYYKVDSKTDNSEPRGEINL
jgi:hypothetical protein